MSFRTDPRSVRNLWIGEISQSMLRISYRNDKLLVFSLGTLSVVVGLLYEQSGLSFMIGHELHKLSRITFAISNARLPDGQECEKSMGW